MVAAPTALPLVTLHHCLASTVWTTNRPRCRCIMASGVSVARSNTNNNHNQDYDSENNESKHNILPSLPLISITVICYFKAIPVLDMILHLFSSHINRTADICLLSKSRIILAAVALPYLSSGNQSHSDSEVHTTPVESSGSHMQWSGFPERDNLPSGKRK